MNTNTPLIKRLLQGLLFGFLVLLGVSLLGDIRQVSAEVLNFRWTLLPAILGLTLFNYTLRGVKWHYYLGQVGVHTLSWVESARLFIAGFPLAVTPAKAGEALKGVWLQRATGLPVGRGIAVVVAERISDGLAVLLLSTAGVLAYPQYWSAFTLILVLLVGIVALSQVRPLAQSLLSLAARLPLIGRFAHSLGEFYEGSFFLFKPRATLTAVGLGVVSWMGEGIGLYLVLLGLGVPGSWHTLGVAVFVLSFSIVIGAASTLPGGLGAAEASIAGMLALLLELGSGTSATATLLIRFATLWFGVSLGLIVWAISPQLLARIAPDERVASSSEPDS